MEASSTVLQPSSSWYPLRKQECCLPISSKAMHLRTLSPQQMNLPSCELKASSCQITPRLASAFYVTSIAGAAFSCANQALALVVDGNAASADIATANPGRMYALIAIEAVALIGAAVGGILARQRKEELEKLNAQLRRINEYLRSKAIIETYAPSLVYAPVGRPEDDKVIDAEREALLKLLIAGKKFLKEKKPHLAYEEFNKALPIAQRIGDPNEVKKTARGLGVSCQHQGLFREAIKFHKLVLEVSGKKDENGGDTEALGSIADCYCELGDLDAAQKYYNQYIDRLDNSEGSEG